MRLTFPASNPFDTDLNREVFQRRLGALSQVDDASDADLILDRIRNEREEMRFRLTYDGEFKSAGKTTRGPEKWSIRKAINPQLAELWTLHPALQGWAFGYKEQRGDVRAPIARKYEELRIPVSVGGYNFLPLVRDSLYLICTLDILFLRKDGPGSLVSGGGDLDNRIKVLFDGLRMPTADEIALGKPDTDPFYCLLEDDKLITDVAIRTDRLLPYPNAPPSQVKLVIDVIVSVSRIMTTLNSGFIGS